MNMFRIVRDLESLSDPLVLYSIEKCKIAFVVTKGSL